MKTKVSFSVAYNPTMANKMGKLMSMMDLGITGVEAHQKDIASWITTKKVDKKYLEMMKKALKEVYERQGNTVIEIKHLI